MGRKSDKNKRIHQAKYIRTYVIYHLKNQGIHRIDEQHLNCCSSATLQEKFTEIFGCDPNVQYLNNRYQKEQDIKTACNSDIDGSYVYFFMTTDGRYVKIGHSSNPFKRIRTVQTGCPLEIKIIGYFEADRKYEEILHKKFKRCRTHGEWFKLKCELLDYVVIRFFL